MINLEILLYQTLLGVTLTLLFIESRFSRKKTCLLVYGATVLLMAADVWLYRILGRERFGELYTLTNHLPIFLVLFYISRNHGWQLIFQFLSGVLFCVMIQHGAALAYVLSGWKMWVLGLTYAILSAAMILFIVHFLRPLYLQVLHHLRHGWWLMCLNIAIYYVIILYLIPSYVGEPNWGTILQPAISLLMMGFYVLILALFSSVEREMENRHSAEMFSVQLSALQRQVESTRDAENALRIERHDLRHRLNTISNLVRSGDQETLLTYIGAAQEQLEEARPEIWCADPVLNAVFSFYFAQAKRFNIEVNAELAFPKILPADAASLSTVFANALENAIHACRALPEAQRKITCRCINRPRLMLEVSNPCASPVILGKDGFPITDGKDSDRGLGLRSIRSFCEKHDALLTCAYQEGWFSLRVAF